MDPPFSLELPEDSKDDEHDSDEELMSMQQKTEEAPSSVNFDFSIKQKEALISKFVDKNEREAYEKEIQRQLKEITIDDDAPDLEKHDELEAKKKRLHCWVMLREGDRGVTETVFIEPTTG